MTRRQFAQLLASAGVCHALPRMVIAQTTVRRRLIVAVSTDTLAGTNLNDARAAAKVWIKEIERNLDINRGEIYPDVFVSSDQIIQMVQSGTIDCAALSAPEYSRLVPFLDPELVVVETNIGDGLEYLVVVRNDSLYQTIGDLRGRQFVFHHHRDDLLLPMWLDILLAENGQESADRFFSGMARQNTINQVVLPVFFRRTDAAGLTRKAFGMAAELNPQLGKGLRTIAASPKVVPQVFCFRRGCPEDDKQQLMSGLLRISSIPAGKQILELYHTEGYEERPVSVMRRTLEMVHQYERLQAKTHAKKARS